MLTRAPPASNLECNTNKRYPARPTHSTALVHPRGRLILPREPRIPGSSIPQNNLFYITRPEDPTKGRGCKSVDSDGEKGNTEPKCKDALCQEQRSRTRRHHETDAPQPAPICSSQCYPPRYARAQPTWEGRSGSGSTTARKTGSAWRGTQG